MAKQEVNKGGLARFIVIRLLLCIPTILILVTLVFFVMRATGDPISAALGGRLPADQLQERIHQAGYDRPVIIQYFEYLGNLLHFDLGTTATDNLKVSDVLLTYGSATFELAFLALIIAFLIGMPLGRSAAFNRDKPKDVSLRIFAILCYATPVFFMGLLFKLIFSIWLGILPVSGRATISSELTLHSANIPLHTGLNILDSLQYGFISGNFAILGDTLLHAIMPAVVLGLLTAGTFLRLVRTNVISTFYSPYVNAARSRGVPEKRLLKKHAWKPSLIPIITVVGMQVAIMLAGAVLTETTFEWKGLGFVLSGYLKARDFMAVQGIVVLVALIVVLCNFIVDVVAALIDPRVRY